jgi:hypothetical protein
VAGVSLESRAAPAAPGPIEHHVQESATLLALVLAASALSQPGVLAGAAVFAAWYWLYREPRPWRLAVATLCAFPFFLLHAFIVWGWSWHLLLPAALPTGAWGTPPAADAIQRSITVEALAGPLWFELTLFCAGLTGRRVHAQVARDHRRDVTRWRALSGKQGIAVPSPHHHHHQHPRDRVTSATAHPPGAIRLGLDGEARRHFDLALPGEIAQHIFLPGASGSGKTTTLMRLADGALANGYAVVIIDCKGGDLGGVARRLAAAHGVPVYVVDPDDPGNGALGYNPCSGDPASVANKIIGAFAFGPNAEIYKNIAMEAVPLVVSGLQAGGQAVTLDALRDAFDTRGIEKIALRVPENDPLRARLLQLAGPASDRAGAGGHRGLGHRLGALANGKFGALFRTTPALDWDAALASPSVTYVALSTLASSEDVDLMGRVLAQDIKQVCARRLRAIGAGDKPIPVLAMWDEFAALREAEQISDLLLQARQALMPTVISVQYIPESVPVRQSVLGAGLIIVHRVESTDAQLLADQFGTRPATEVTHQIDYTTGDSDMGSIRRGEAYLVHPNYMRNLRPGQAAVRSAPGDRHAIVQVYRDTA